MKHKLLALATAAAALSPMVASASDGTITFQGAVKATTCAVTAPSSFTVTLPTVSVGTLASSGAVAGATRFAIAISGCSGSETQANAFFEAGSTVDAITGRLKNATGSGRATNVDLQLTTAAGTPIDLSKASGAQYTPQTGNIVSNAATLEYAVRYYSLGGASAGTVESSVTYSVVYN